MQTKGFRYLRSQSCLFTESQNGLGRELKDHQVPTPTLCPWAGAPSTRADCSKTPSKLTLNISRDGHHRLEQKLICILELSFQSCFYIKQTPHFLSSQVLCCSLKITNYGSHKGFQRKMFLLAGSGQETSSCEG